MSEPDVEAVIKAAEAAAAETEAAVSDLKAAEAAKPAVQPTSFTAMPAGEVPADDPRVAQLVRGGMDQAEAVKLVADLQRMWG